MVCWLFVRCSVDGRAMKRAQLQYLTLLRKYLRNHRPMQVWRGFINTMSLKSITRAGSAVRVLLLYSGKSYLARSTILVSRQFLDLDSGRVSAKRTLSPIPAVFCLAWD